MDLIKQELNQFNKKFLTSVVNLNKAIRSVKPAFEKATSFGEFTKLGINGVRQEFKKFYRVKAMKGALPDWLREICDKDDKELAKVNKFLTGLKNFKETEKDPYNYITTISKIIDALIDAKNLGSAHSIFDFYDKTLDLKKIAPLPANLKTIFNTISENLHYLSTLGQKLKSNISKEEVEYAVHDAKYGEIEDLIYKNVIDRMTYSNLYDRLDAINDYERGELDDCCQYFPQQITEEIQRLTRKIEDHKLSDGTYASKNEIINELLTKTYKADPIEKIPETRVPHNRTYLKYIHKCLVETYPIMKQKTPTLFYQLDNEVQTAISKM